MRAGVASGGTGTTFATSRRGNDSGGRGEWGSGNYEIREKREKWTSSYRFKNEGYIGPIA